MERALEWSKIIFSERGGIRPTDQKALRRRDNDFPLIRTFSELRRASFSDILHLSRGKPRAVIDVQNARLMKRLELIQVECYSGYKANESPRAFVWRGKRYGIVEIRDRWYEGGVSRRSIRLDYYKVLADDGEEYILRYHSLFDKWALLLKRPGFQT